jgi:hypothetical protein
VPHRAVPRRAVPRRPCPAGSQVRPCQAKPTRAPPGICTHCTAPTALLHTALHRLHCTVMYSAHHRLAFHLLSDQSIHSPHLLTSLQYCSCTLHRVPSQGPLILEAPLPRHSPQDLSTSSLRPTWPLAHLASGPLGLWPTCLRPTWPPAHLAFCPIGLCPLGQRPTWPSATLILLFDVLRWPRRPSSSSF